MKAAFINQFGGVDVLEVGELPAPEISAPDEVLIEVKAASVNPVEWKHRKGNHKKILGAPFPIVLGYDAAGIVKQVGENVKKYKPGDRVHTRVNKKYGGTYAQFALSSASTLAPLPEKISFEEGAALPLAGLTALQALRDKGKIKTGDEVLINGSSSGVGHYALQLSKTFGAIVTAVCSEKRKDMMQKLHADHIIDYTKENFTQQNKKYDIVFDVVGTESFLSCKNVLKKGGTYITSLPRLKILLHKPLAFFQGKKVKTLLMKPIGTDIEYMDQLILEGKIKTYIDKVFALDEIQKAHEYSESGRVVGKIVIRVS